jgi:CDP-6-deoxy-D-xylo-4-hexulose-3-dehydrase
MTYALALSSWDQEELDAIQRVIGSGRLTMGAEVRAFEREFADRFGKRHAVMVNSGSSANLVAVAALCFRGAEPLRRGDEVIVPAISWATTYHPLQQYGLKLRFVDVELGTLNIDVSQLERALTPRTRMVVAVNVLGNPCRLTILRRFCDEHGLILFEDNCESLGATVDGRFTGTFGDVGTFSFFYSHHISTIEGGMLVTDDEEIDHLARSLRNHGWTRDVPTPTTIYAPHAGDFTEAYRFILPGYNVRPLEFCGAIGREQLRKLDRFVAARRQNAKTFLELFGRDERFIVQREEGESSWFCFTMIVNPASGARRAAALAALAESGIEHRMITGGCFLRHDVIRHFEYDVVGETPNAYVAHDCGFFVGNHHHDLTRELQSLRTALDRVRAEPVARGRR